MADPRQSDRSSLRQQLPTATYCHAARPYPLDPWIEDDAVMWPPDGSNAVTTTIDLLEIDFNDLSNSALDKFADVVPLPIEIHEKAVAGRCEFVDVLVVGRRLFEQIVIFEKRDPFP